MCGVTGSSAADTLLGIVIFSIGCFNYAVGPIVQKYALLKDGGEHQPQEIRLWVCGIAMYLSSGCLWAASCECMPSPRAEDMPQMCDLSSCHARVGSDVFANLSLLAPLLSISVFLNFLFARLMLNEDFTSRHSVACAFIMASGKPR